MDVLDIGCGKNKTPGAIGIDFNADAAADIAHDLNQFPWPLNANAFDKIICSHIVEHVADLVRFMQEAHRVARTGAQIEIVTPHFTNRFSYTDPTHLRHLSLRSFDYFLVPRTLRHTLLTRAFETQYIVPDFYARPLFRLVRAHLRLARPFRILGIQWLANRFPDFYELYLAFIFPARDLYFTLEAIK